MIVVLMGVTGSGKTTIGMLLAQRIHAAFADADDFHSAANKAKMAAGHALTDQDREPWLETLNGLMRTWTAANKSAVLACSALKASYRKTLMRSVPDGAAVFVLLDASKELIQGRLASRKDHYMNPKLLDSQIAILEPPADALRVVNDGTPQQAVDRMMHELAL